MFTCGHVIVNLSLSPSWVEGWNTVQILKFLNEAVMMCIWLFI